MRPPDRWLPIRRRIQERIHGTRALAASVQREWITRNEAMAALRKIVEADFPLPDRSVAWALLWADFDGALQQWAMHRVESADKVERAVAMPIRGRAPEDKIFAAAAAAVPAWEGVTLPELHPLTKEEAENIAVEEMAWAMRAAARRRFKA